MFSLLQHRSRDGARRVIAARDGAAHFVAGFSDVRSLATAAIAQNLSLAALVAAAGSDGTIDPAPELAGSYLTGPDAMPRRLGLCLANEFSDHVTERHNYLWLAHSKLRHAALG